MSRHPYYTKYSDNRSRGIMKSFDDFQSKPTGFLETIRPMVKQLSSISIIGTAIVNQQSPTTNFKNQTGQLVYDSYAGQITRLYIQVQSEYGIKTGIFASSMIANLYFDNLIATCLDASVGASDTGGFCFCNVQQPFDINTITWNNQPAVTMLVDPSCNWQVFNDAPYVIANSQGPVALTGYNYTGNLEAQPKFYTYGLCVSLEAPSNGTMRSVVNSFPQIIVI